MHLTESDTRAKHIDPKLKESGWEQFVYREYYFTDGRKLLGGKRGKRLFVDYLLRYKNTNLAIIEAKKLGKHPTEGLQQAIGYAEKLKVKFVFATNGEKIYQFDMKTGTGDYIDTFPTPEILFQEAIDNLTSLKKQLLSIPFFLTGDKQPRYYQEIAVNKAVEAIADGNKLRILLTLATGTGKTFIAFQIVHKLLSVKWNLDKADRRPKILFLADRNILADQAINTFNDPYEKDLIKIDGSEISARNGIVPTNAFIFFAIYQAISEKENIGGYYKQYPADFFDLIIIDECHRGSAKEEGSWREILDYFGSAVHLGLTATPKRSDNVDTYDYFKKPVYEYSLKDGINDGFLSPYKVKKVRTNIDSYIYTNADRVIEGAVEDRIYYKREFNRLIIIPKQIELIAQAILDIINTLDKSIVFCVDQAHALNMRDAINKFKKVADPNYCVRITSDEGKAGRDLLELFRNNDRDIPVILTSSQMLTTGVDAHNVRNIIIVREIESMVEFKQIVGRGTRLFDGKDFFTIIDFSEVATDHFYDPDWDGLPEGEAVEGGDDSADTGGNTRGGGGGNTGGGGTEPPLPPRLPRPVKIVIELSNGRKLKVLDIETRYIDESGKPLTTLQFLEKLIGFIPDLYNSEEELRKLWSRPETREALLAKMADSGIDEEQLDVLKKIFEAEQSDVFDILLHISYEFNLITRVQRATLVKENNAFFEVFSNLKARDFLRFILERYETDGVKELKRERLFSLIELNNLGTTKEAAKVFGSAQNLIDAFYKLQENLYAS